MSTPAVHAPIRVHHDWRRHKKKMERESRTGEDERMDKEGAGQGRTGQGRAGQGRTPMHGPMVVYATGNAKLLTSAVMLSKRAFDKCMTSIAEQTHLGFSTPALFKHGSQGPVCQP